MRRQMVTTMYNKRNNYTETKDNYLHQFSWNYSRKKGSGPGEIEIPHPYKQNKISGIYRLVDPPNRVKFIAKIGRKACTQSSTHHFPELFATHKSNYVTLSYKYNAGIQPE